MRVSTISRKLKGESDGEKAMSTDERIRSYGFHVTDRPANGPTLWRLGKRPEKYTQYDALIAIKKWEREAASLAAKGKVKISAGTKK